MTLQFSAWPPGVADKYRRLASELSARRGGLTGHAVQALTFLATETDLADFTPGDIEKFISQVTSEFPPAVSNKAPVDEVAREECIPTPDTAPPKFVRAARRVTLIGDYDYAQQLFSALVRSSVANGSGVFYGDELWLACPSEVLRIASPPFGTGPDCSAIAHGLLANGVPDIVVYCEAPFSRWSRRPLTRPLVLARQLGARAALGVVLSIPERKDVPAAITSRVRQLLSTFDTRPDPDVVVANIAGSLTASDPDVADVLQSLDDLASQRSPQQHAPFSLRIDDVANDGGSGQRRIRGVVESGQIRLSKRAAARALVHVETRSPVHAVDDVRRSDGPIPSIEFRTVAPQVKGAARGTLIAEPGMYASTKVLTAQVYVPNSEYSTGRLFEGAVEVAIDGTAHHGAIHLTGGRRRGGRELGLQRTGSVRIILRQTISAAAGMYLTVTQSNVTFDGQITALEALKE